MNKDVERIWHYRLEQSLSDLLWQAFFAGWESAGEGFNGECHFTETDKEIKTLLEPRFLSWLNKQEPFHE